MSPGRHTPFAQSDSTSDQATPSGTRNTSTVSTTPSAGASVTSGGGGGGGGDQVAGEVGLPSGSSLSLDGRRGLTLGRRTTQRFFDDATGIGGAGAASLLLSSGDFCGGNGERFHGIVGDESPGGGKDRQGHPRQPDPAGGRDLVTDRLRARRWPTGAGCSVDVAKACHGHDPRGWENREGGIGTGPGGNGSRASIAAKTEVFGP